MDLAARSAAVVARLNTVNAAPPARALLDVFLGEPVANLDSDQRAHPYAAVYPSPGHHDPAAAPLTDVADLLTWTFQVTAAGGDADRCMRATGRVLAVLLGWRLEATADPVRLEFDPGPMRVDRDVSPSRCYIPLLFTAPLANTTA